MAKPETLQKQYEEVWRSFRAIDEFRAELMGFLPLASGVGWIALDVCFINTPPVVT